MKNTTLLFLIKKDSDRVSDVMLAMKKIGFGIGRYNGVGGKVKEGESVEDATVRETSEEIGVSVDIKDLNKVGEIEFRFQDKSEWNQVVHIYTTEIWSGEPTESEEMKPYWYKVEDIPYNDMWEDDKYWLPKVLNGEYVKGYCLFDSNQKIIEHNL
jgi:8-oxo-dGTP pyrophosphatase MutT (NUDIX family)